MIRILALGLVVFALALMRSLADGIGFADESWFLQVVARLRAGDTLYRDVFLGVTPLSAWVTSGVSLAIGIEILTVKVVTNACFAVTTVLAGRLAREAGLSAGASWVVMAAMFVWARPYNNPPYTPMAMAFLVAALVASLVAARAERGRDFASRAWLGAGVLAGLAFASKQNVGVLALASVCGALAVAAGTGPGRPGRHAMWVVAGFSAASLLVLAPVAGSGGLPALWDYGFAGKGAYLDIGSVSYASSLRALFAPLAAGPTAGDLQAAMHGLVLLLPLAVLIAAAAAAGHLNRLDWTMVLFAVTTALVAYPRLDRFHMAYAVPVHLVALGRLLPRLTVGRPHPALGRVAGWGVAALALAVALRPVVTLAREDRQPLAMTHFRGGLVAPEQAAEIRAQAAALRDATGAGPVFIVIPTAGFWYLASGARNPTPFDIPARTATGAHGIDRLLARLEAGEITRVCLDDGPPGRQSLVEVETFVRHHFDGGPDVGPCTMYAAPAAGVASKRSS